MGWLDGGWLCRALCMRTWYELLFTPTTLAPLNPLMARRGPPMPQPTSRTWGRGGVGVSGTRTVLPTRRRRTASRHVCPTPTRARAKPFTCLVRLAEVQLEGEEVLVPPDALLQTFVPKPVRKVERVPPACPPPHGVSCRTQAQGREATRGSASGGGGEGKGVKWRTVPGALRHGSHRGAAGLPLPPRWPGNAPAELVEGGGQVIVCPGRWARVRRGRLCGGPTSPQGALSTAAGHPKRQPQHSARCFRGTHMS